MMMYGVPSSSRPVSMTRQTCGLLRRTAARASRRKRSLPSSPRAEGSVGLMARTSSRSMWRAATTTPMAPSPRTRSNAVLGGDEVAGLGEGGGGHGPVPLHALGREARANAGLALGALGTECAWLQQTSRIGAFATGTVGVLRAQGAFLRVVIAVTDADHIGNTCATNVHFARNSGCIWRRHRHTPYCCYMAQPEAPYIHH